MTSVTLPRNNGVVVVGRDAHSADVPLSHPSISRRHVELRVQDDTCIVRDLGSTNGTFVDGRVISTPTLLPDGAVLELGPYRFIRVGDALRDAPRVGVGQIELRSVSFEVTTGKGVRRLIDDISVRLSGPALTCVIGPSGSGKSTLLSLLAGRVSPTGGQVLIDGVDVHRDFSRIKDRLAFVPQREALRNELTIAEFLRFSAQLRLPRDLTRREADQLVMQLVERTGLAEHLETPIGALSGGQRRRLGMVNELLSQPTVLLLDEVTSGLDEEAAHELMALVTEIARSGVTVVCVTHTVGTIEDYADECLVLAPGGVPAYLGPPSALCRAFGVSALGEIYRPIREAPRMPTPGPGPSPSSAGDLTAPPRSRQRGLARSLRSLDHVRLQILRSVAVLTGDSSAVVLALGQAVLIGVLLRVVFNTGELTPMQDGQLGFLLAISAFWFGANNSAKELVKDVELIRQEWAVGIAPGTTIAAKAAVLLALCVLQVLLLVATVRISGVPLGEPVGIAMTCVTGAAVGIGLGLFLSAAARTTDAAATGLPMLLIPQLLLSEAFVRPLDGVAILVAKLFVPAFWLNRAVGELSGISLPGAMRPAIAFAAHLVLSLTAAIVLLARRLRA